MLWILVLLNIVVRDIHDFFRLGSLEEIMPRTVNGVELTEKMMLVAGIMIEIPIAMVLRSRLINQLFHSDNGYPVWGISTPVPEGIEAV
ncbi:MAG: DUF6326 family protein [Chloroflexota bacterium]